MPASVLSPDNAVLGCEPGERLKLGHDTSTVWWRPVSSDADEACGHGIRDPGSDAARPTTSNPGVGRAIALTILARLECQARAS